MIRKSLQSICLCLSLSLSLCFCVLQRDGRRKKETGKQQKKRYNVSRWQVSEVGHRLKTLKASGALTRWIYRPTFLGIPSTQHPIFFFLFIVISFLLSLSLSLFSVELSENDSKFILSTRGRVRVVFFPQHVTVNINNGNISFSFVGVFLLLCIL